jgi:hypothetical protein
MRFFQTLPFLGLASATLVDDSFRRAGLVRDVPVRRQVDVIQGAFTKISSDTQAVDTAVKAFSGDGGPLAAATSTLLTDLNSGISSVNNAQPVDIGAATQIATYVTGLQSTVEQTINDLKSAKSKIVAAGLGGVVLKSLQDQKTASQDFSDAVTKKTPTALQAVAQQLSSGIISSIQSGIDAYKDQANAPAPSGGSSATPSKSSAAPSKGASSTAVATSAAPQVSTTLASSPATFTGAAYSQVPVMGFALAAVGLAAVI